MCSLRCGFASEQIAAPQTVLHVAEKCEPGGTSRIRFRPVTNAQDTANNILVDFNAESQSNLLGNSRAAPTGITPFHFQRRRRRVPWKVLSDQAVAHAWSKTTSDTFVSPTGGGDVEGFRTIAERRTRTGRMKRVHRPAMTRSEERRLGARLRPRWRIRS